MQQVLCVCCVWYVVYTRISKKSHNEARHHHCMLKGGVECLIGGVHPDFLIKSQSVDHKSSRLPWFSSNHPPTLVHSMPSQITTNATFEPTNNLSSRLFLKRHPVANQVDLLSSWPTSLFSFPCLLWPIPVHFFGPILLLDLPCLFSPFLPMWRFLPHLTHTHTHTHLICECGRLMLRCLMLVRWVELGYGLHSLSAKGRSQESWRDFY